MEVVEITTTGDVAVADAEAALTCADLDPETEFLALERLKRQRGEQEKQPQTTTASEGFEWDVYKENVRPLKRGRNVELLNRALRSNGRDHRSLLQTRRRMIEAIHEYQGDDPLQPWLDCIKWVQEAFPTGGECSGLVVIYEQCVRSFWHDDRYRDDLRYLKIWLEYARSCADAEVIFSFLESNQIGLSHSIFFKSYALYMESKNKLRRADDIYNLGIARKAQPLEILEAAYRTFLMRSTQKKGSTKEDIADDTLPVRNFGSVLTSAESRREPAETFHIGTKPLKLQRIDANRSISIYHDAKSGANNQHLRRKGNENTWNTLGSQSDRNKENSSIPAKWTSYKVPQKIGTRTGSSASSSCIEVYVDEECSELPGDEVARKPVSGKLKLGNSERLKKETEMLKENPLRNFPLHSLR